MSSSQSKLVRGAFYEGFEGVARVQPHSHAFAGAAFQGGGVCWLVERGVQFGRQLIWGVVGGQLLIHVCCSVGLHVDEQLALTGSNFIECVTYERHVAGKDAFTNVSVWNLETKAHFVVGNSNSVVECGEPHRFRNLGT